MDQGLFVVIGSDIEEDEFQSVLVQKRLKLKKLRKRRPLNRKKRKTSKSSSVSSPVSSLSLSSTPPDSDDSASSCISSGTFPLLQAEQNKLKRQKTYDDKNDESKKVRTENNITIVSDAHLSSLTKTETSTSTTNLCNIPTQWHSVNSSHYIFSSDEYGDSEGNRNEKDCSKNQVLSSIIRVGEKNSQLWHKCDSGRMIQKGHNSPKSQTAGRLSSCLTGCKSCADYSFQSLSEQENNEMSCYLALDCEFVGVGPSNKSALGRCSIVDHRGEILYDQFVKPPEEVTDYRTRWSGLRPRNIRCGIPLVAAQEKIAAIIKDKVVIGHAVHNDFHVMGLHHPAHLIRDTASCKLLREMASLTNKACALRKLTFALLGRSIQKKEHCSVTDARACLDLFRLVRTQWEPILQAKLKRRIARQTEDKLKTSVDSSETHPELNSYFDDEYWPDDLFKDSA